MKKLSKDQSGFITMILILVAVLVVVIGFVYMRLVHVRGNASVCVGGQTVCVSSKSEQ